MNKSKGGKGKSGQPSLSQLSKMQQKLNENMQKAREQMQQGQQQGQQPGKSGRDKDRGPA
jgi:prefoldin subunit 5